ncbi:hypothetical protein UPYG_G00093390 [Umbra pygmaea]|uniref:Uncharacterized protein n=1 Tax=Umbra pygmaea TaxID=75934 RepID=A0ABD0X0H3_UMBPY
MMSMQMSESEGTVKVAEWQQTYYASDSGIQSGATTMREDEGTEYSASKYNATMETSAATPSDKWNWVEFVQRRSVEVHKPE